MQGKILKGIAGFYYVDVTGLGIFECKAKGIFRKDNRKPLVGDDVILDCLDESAFLGNIVQLLPRKNQLVRPAVANIDQAMIIFAVTRPEPNFNLLDRFLIMMGKQGIPCLIVFNKVDIANPAALEALAEVYANCDCHLLFTSANAKQGLKEMREALHGRTTTVAGPSGVGKSSLINCLQQEVSMETAAISAKIDRGKHTTRHTQLITVEEDSYIMDTPGFSSLELVGIEKEELCHYYPEFLEYEKNCRFQGCSHIHEPVCGIQDALEEGGISRLRYGNYVTLYHELDSRKKY